MDTIVCPVECVGVGCDQPDFIERNGAWLLTIVGVMTGCFGGLLTFFLKSRCTTIKFCGVQLDRQVIDLAADETEVGMQPTTSETNQNE